MSSYIRFRIIIFFALVEWVLILSSLLELSIQVLVVAGAVTPTIRSRTSSKVFHPAENIKEDLAVL